MKPNDLNPSGLHPIAQDKEVFSEILRLIIAARQRAFHAVNTELIDLYWEVGGRINRKIEAAEWGDGVVDGLAEFIARTQPGMRGFTRPNLFRMRQLYEAYRDQEKVSPLVRQPPWTHNLIILGQSKLPEEREFYLRSAVQEKWSKRELERQVKAALFERAILSPAKVSPAVATRLFNRDGRTASRVRSPGHLPVRPNPQFQSLGFWRYSSASLHRNAHSSSLGVP